LTVSMRFPSLSLRADPSNMNFVLPSLSCITMLPTLEDTGGIFLTVNVIAKLEQKLLFTTGRNYRKKQCELQFQRLKELMNTTFYKYPIYNIET